MSLAPATLPRIWTVRALTQYLRGVVEGDSHLRAVWVRGEISNLRDHVSGHLYFTLKDEHAALRCVMFRSRRGRLRGLVPENGLSVLAGGSLGIYERDGLYQLYVDDLQAEGVGNLHLAFEQLKRRLQAEGLFDASRKRPLPALPRRVAIVTAPGGAALRDFLQVTGRRQPGMDILIVPALVQGEEAPASLLAALGRLEAYCRRRPEAAPDVVVIARGGGSLEDLWAFNDERLARAAAAFPLPVVSAIGHETDFTILDFVADLRAPTPSAAAELVAPLRAESLRRVRELEERLRAALVRRHARAGERLAQLRARLPLAQPERLLAGHRQRLDDLADGLALAARQYLANRQARFREAAARLDALSPLATLQRGYSLCLDGAGHLLRDARQVQAGQPVTVRLARGSLQCRVRSVAEGTDGGGWQRLAESTTGGGPAGKGVGA